MKRFVKRDVWSGDPTAPQTLNRYAYATGNPVSMIDPFGRAPMNSDAVTVLPFSDIGGATPQPQGPVFGPPSPTAADRKMDKIYDILTDTSTSDRFRNYALEAQRYLIANEKKYREPATSLKVKVGKIRNNVNSPVSDKAKFLIKTFYPVVGGVRG